MIPEKPRILIGVFEKQIHLSVMSPESNQVITVDVFNINEKDIEILGAKVSQFINGNGYHLTNGYMFDKTSTQIRKCEHLDTKSLREIVLKLSPDMISTSA